MMGFPFTPKPPCEGVPGHRGHVEQLAPQPSSAEEGGRYPPGAGAERVPEQYVGTSEGGGDLGPGS